MDIANKIMMVAIGVGVGTIIIVIVSIILGGAGVLGSAVLGSFTGFVSVAQLIPLVLVTAALYLAWQRIQEK